MQCVDAMIEQEPMLFLQRTLDTQRYIINRWNECHEVPINADALRLFLCDEHCGDLREEQKAFARRCRDEMRNVYGAVVLRLLLCEEML